MSVQHHYSLTNSLHTPKLYSQKTVKTSLKPTQINLFAYLVYQRTIHHRILPSNYFFILAQLLRKVVTVLLMFLRPIQTMLVFNSLTIRQSTLLSVVLQNDLLLLGNHLLFGCLLLSKEDRLGMNIFESAIESLKRLLIVSLLIRFFLVLFHPKNRS